MNGSRLDRARVRRFFDLAADSYDESAVLQREVGERMLERLDYVRLEPAVVLDAGCATGRFVRRLGKRYRRARVIGLDLSSAMLRAARRRQGWFGRTPLVAGDLARLPLADGSVDLVFSNFAVQWCDPLDQAMNEFRRVLRPGGLLMFTTFGPDTLHELRTAWETVDRYSHVSPFPDMHEVGDTVAAAGFSGTVMDMELFTLTYPTVRRLMEDLRAIGARNATRERPRGLTGPRRMAAVEAAYERFRTADGVLPATYEVIYGHAWAPEGQPGEVAIPLASIGGRGER